MRITLICIMYQIYFYCYNTLELQQYNLFLFDMLRVIYIGVFLSN